MWPRSEARTPINRVMIVGGPGSGKSTLARMIGERTGLPVHHMDLIHWQPGWVERPKAEKIPMARAVEATERWVFEGGLSATYDTRAARADLIVWLDLPVGLRLWRCFVKRRLQYAKGIARPDVPKDCPERFDWEFFWFIVKTRRRGRARIARLLEDAGVGKSVHLRSRHAVSRFTASLPG